MLRRRMNSTCVNTAKKTESQKKAIRGKHCELILLAKEIKNGYMNKSPVGNQYDCWKKSLKIPKG